jgi:hypothetical protein
MIRIPIGRKGWFCIGFLPQPKHRMYVAGWRPYSHAAPMPPPKKPDAPLREQA